MSAIFGVIFLGSVILAIDWIIVLIYYFLFTRFHLKKDYWTWGMQLSNRGILVIIVGVMYYFLLVQFSANFYVSFLIFIFLTVYCIAISLYLFTNHYIVKWDMEETQFRKYKKMKKISLIIVTTSIILMFITNLAYCLP